MIPLKTQTLLLVPTTQETITSRRNADVSDAEQQFHENICRQFLDPQTAHSNGAGDTYCFDAVRLREQRNGGLCRLRE